MTGLSATARVREVFCRVLEAAPARRPAMLEKLCQGDAGRVAAVRRLLAHVPPDDGFLAPPAIVVWRGAAAEVGRIVGDRWRLVRVLGVGGAGAAYAARDVETGRRGVLKLVQGLSRVSIDGMRREIALLRWLRIPGVVRLIDDGVERGAAYCVTELVRGAPFPGPRRGRRWTTIEPAVLGLLETVGRVHAAGVLHCDLKPANVLVDERGAVTVIDLGLSIATLRSSRERDAVHGSTPAYAAPERDGVSPPDPRWDLYAVGVMVFEALAGRRPRPGSPGECGDLGLPVRVRRVLEELLEVRPSRRAHDAFAVLLKLRPPSHPRRRRTPWTKEDLRARFAGPDLLLHLREDAAGELYLRTGGRPVEVERELDAWIRSGLVREERSLVTIDRSAIERLHLLSEHESFARTLRDGSARTVALGSRRIAKRLLVAGRPLAAASVLFEGACAARIAGDERLEIGTLLDVVAAAVRTASAAQLDRALLLLQRASTRDPRVSELEAIVRGALQYSSGRPRAAMDVICPVSLRVTDPDVARVAWSVRIPIARSLGEAEERSAVAAFRRCLRRVRIRSAASLRASADGWLKYRSCDFGAAVRLHRLAARRALDTQSRSRHLLDAVAAAVEGCMPDAVEMAERARRAATALRNPVHEGRAHHLLRSALLRSGAIVPLDEEFVEAAQTLGLPSLAANAAFTEAALAWRAGERRPARRLALVAATIWGTAPPAAIALALAAAAGGALPETSIQRARRAAVLLPPATAVQALALLAMARPAWRPRLRRQAARLMQATRKLPADGIREVLSLRETRAILRGNRELLSHPAGIRRVPL